jgi:cysteine synthase
MIADAEADGRPKPGGTIVEGTSGILEWIILLLGI